MRRRSYSVGQYGFAQACVAVGLSFLHQESLTQAVHVFERELALSNETLHLWRSMVRVSVGQHRCVSFLLLLHLGTLLLNGIT
jgi:hypothetical protein